MSYIPTSAYEPGFPLEWEGLDLGSADDATPRLYGVSFGNGNDGVSHTYPSYYVRTCEPFALAAAALLSEFKPKYRPMVAEAMEVDGEADYTIYATLYNPLDDEDGSWCEVNGAYSICEVFREDDPREGRPTYDSLGQCFGEGSKLLALAREEA